MCGVVHCLFRYLVGLTKFGSKLISCWPVWTKFWLGSAELGLMSTKRRPTPAKVGPTLTEIGLPFTTFGPNRPNLGWA